MLYIQIKFRNHKLISLGTELENMHSNKKNLQNFTFYRPYYDVIINKPKNISMNQQYTFLSFVYV